ncbi:MAG TPA: energy-coupling factor transporter transmembrane component T [Gaiellaceae bacterium]|nr:energy-coupling factor transporter transmembrane component T [Gaiellaceae bacterium]
MSAAPLTALLAAAVVAALVATHTASIAVICAVLLIVAWRAPASRRWPYLVGTLVSTLLVVIVTPFVETVGTHPLWTGPIVPVLGQLDVTREELHGGLFQGLRLAAVGLAFAAYALHVDHDRLLASAGWARRSALAAALATRLVPLLERDARDLRTALRGRNVELGPVRLLSPLLAGSLERGLDLAEAMEARGYGRPGHTRAPRASWRARDHAALAAALVLVVVGALWL